MPNRRGRSASAASVLPRIGAQAPNAGKASRTRFFALVVLFSALLAACRHPPPEQALRDTVARMQKAGEARDVAGFMAQVDDDFAGPDGMDRQRLRQFLAVVALRNQRIGTTLGPLDVRILGERATVDFTLGASGGDAGWLPDRTQVYDVHTGWRRDGDDWKLLSASWQPKL